MEIDIWEMLKNAIASGNWIIVVIVGIIIVGYMYVQSKVNNNDEIKKSLEVINTHIIDVENKIHNNTLADMELAKRVEDIESMAKTIYTNTSND